MEAICLPASESVNTICYPKRSTDYLELGRFIYLSGDNSFNKVTGYKIGYRGSIPSRVSVLHQVLAHIWGPPTLRFYRMGSSVSVR
jgi:hypothetical protein